jgi:glycosyltransferase involved in cell wall biosynthesis
MRLLYLADIRFPMERANGIQTIETCHGLARRGIDVELVVRRSDARSDAECLAFFDLAPHPKLRLRRVSTGWRLGFLVQAFVAMFDDWDVVFTRDLLIADLARRVSQAPVIYEAHTVAAVFAEEHARMYTESTPSGGGPSASKLARLDAREGRVCRNVSGLVTITHALLRALEERHGSLATSLVAPDGCRLPESLPAPPESEALPLVYYIGQLYPWKGVDVLVDAMRHVDAQLVVVGGLPPEPDLDRLQRLAKELGVDARVSFRGFLPPNKLAAERQRASIFVVPNLDSTTARLYTSPLKLFEAMASGRPIVASDLPSIREVLTHEDNALLVPPGDAKALASAIDRLVRDRALRDRLAARAFEDARNYSWEARADRIRTMALGLAHEPPEATPDF